MYPYLWQCYSEPSFLYYGENVILSEVGAQQGDPTGPLAFSLAIQPLINSLSSDLNVWYLDDGTIGDFVEKVLTDFKNLIEESRKILLLLISHINPSGFWLTPQLVSIDDDPRPAFSTTSLPYSLHHLPHNLSNVFVVYLSLLSH
jgi:hypothetical protein